MEITYVDFQEKIKNTYSKKHQNLLNQYYNKYPDKKYDIRGSQGVELDFVNEVIELSFNELPEEPNQKLYDNTVNAIVDDLISIVKMNINNQLRV